jgi:rfaE bifunctional protein nucleotidyltransferase chain/domain
LDLKSNDHTKKIYSWAELSTLTSLLKELKLTVALCHGVFDLLHPGHVQHFKVARKLGQLLIVSITGDSYVNKGPGRPIFKQDIRAQTIAALQDVDFVIICEQSTAIEIIEALKPNYYVKGSDYINDEDDLTGMIAKEKEMLQKYGGEVYFTDEIKSSSSSLINKFYSNFEAETSQWIRDFKESHGFDQVVNELDKIQELKVIVLGETIIDKYTYCSPLAKTSKDPLLAFHQHTTNTFPGGVLAIANNCAGWIKQAKIISFTSSEDSILNLFREKINTNIQTEFVKTPDRPNILKHRYVDIESNSRIFEYYDFSDAHLLENIIKKIKDLISSNVDKYDLILVADYGHGFFTPDLINFLDSTDCYLSINTQANAGNRGFNTISKFPRADVITMNSSELRLELRNKNPNYFEIIPKLIISMKAKIAIVTLGSDGLIIFNDQGEFERVPAFASKVVDKVGAGDAVFAMASLLAKTGASLKVIGFLTNLVAANEVAQLGHQKSLSLSDLKKHSKAILG